MFTAAEAERLIFTLITSIRETESLDLMAEDGDSEPLLGRVLAEPVRSGLDFPHWDNSAMDGYALRAADVAQVPADLAVVEEIPAGTLPQKVLKPGEAARILTGAMMPEGADAVVMQEETERDRETVRILQSAEAGAFVRKRGSFSQVGDVLLEVGRSLFPAEVALLAAAQQTQVSVFRRPRVAILSTGSELVRADVPLQPGQIVDSNQYALRSLVAQTGAVPVPLGIIPDDRAAVRDAIASALTQVDMVLSSGGVSVGDYDYIDEVLAELGATLHIRSVAVKPGKPLTVASFERQPEHQSAYQPERQSERQIYFGLPGNPASAMVGFWRFVAPAIAKLSGRVGPHSPTFVWAEATTDLKAGGRRETYLWGQLSAGENGYLFGRAAGSHSSGNLVNLANTTGLGVVPQGETLIEKGQRVRVLAIR